VNRALAALLTAVIAAALVACSPEASRTRNSGPGADVGNHSNSLPEPSMAPALPGG
jgi:hypothetical protein